MTIQTILHQPLSLTLRKAGGLASRILDSSAARTKEKAVELSLRHVALPIVTGSVMLYQVAEEKKDHHGNPEGLLRRFVESGLGSLLIEKTQGIYSLLGIGINAYDAGQKDSVLEQIQGVIKNTTFLISGYIGHMLAAGGFTDAPLEFEDTSLHNLLNTVDQTGETILSRLAKTGRTEIRALQTSLTKLKNELQKLYPATPPTTPLSLAEIQKLKVSIAQLKKEVHEKLWPQLEENALRALHADIEKLFSHLNPQKALEILDPWEHLVNRLNLSQNAARKFSAWSAPYCGYLLFSMAGLWLADQGNKWIAEAYPELKEEKLPKLLKPLDVPLLTRNIPLPFITESGGHHGSHGGSSLVYSIDVPHVGKLH